MSENLAQKTVSSAAWTYLSYVLSKSSTVITTIVLAALLTPGELGIVGFAVTSMAFLDAVRDLGVGIALIQRRDNIENAAHTAFWINISSNVLMWLLALISAPFVASFFSEPQVTVILPVLALTFIVNSLGSTHDALLQREMAFSKRVIPAVFNSFFKGVVSITMALLGYSVWSLVWGQIVGQSIYSIMVWRIVPWRPRFQFDLKIAGELIRYGYKVAIDSLLSALQSNIDYVFIGRFLGETSLGLYTVAFRVPEMVIINFCNVIAQVLFPAYASIQDDPAQMKKAVFNALRYIALVTVPAGIGLALISNLFVGLIFNEDYAGAGPIMGALSLYGMLLAISWNIGDVYKAVDRADILWKTAFFEFFLLAPVLYILAQRDAFSVAIGHVIVAFIISMVRLGIAMRILKMGFIETFSQFVPAVVGSTVMGVAVWLALQALATTPWLALVAGIVVGGIVYPAVLWFFERELMMEGYYWVQRKLKGKKKVEE